MRIKVFDIEANGLDPDKIYCVSIAEVVDGKPTITTLTDYEDMKKFFTSDQDCYVWGHNITLWDIPVIERILNIKVKFEYVDSLFFSWYLYPDRKSHGLEDWGAEIKKEKKEILDWHNLELKEYIDRCEQDVAINYNIVNRMIKKLINIYSDEEGNYDLKPIIDYMIIKGKHIRIAQDCRWKLDLSAAEDLRDKLQKEKFNRIIQLSRVMPKVGVFSEKEKPAKLYNKKGELTVIGKEWERLTKSCNLPIDYEGVIKVLKAYKEPNPNSPQQVKDWLFSLGWEPEIYKEEYKENESGKKDLHRVPQINKENKELCDSVLRLIEKEPKVALLEGYSVVKTRLDTVKGFIRDHKDGYLTARIAGLTNTFRWRHKELVNLPGVDKKYGKEVRSLLIANDGYELLGTDMSSLENRTANHYIHMFDPEYVKEMSDKYYDAHLKIALSSGMLTKDEVDFYKWVDTNGEYPCDNSLTRLSEPMMDKKVKEIKKVRQKAKTTNYSSMYNVGADTLARNLKIKKSEAQKLLDAYWKVNWAIKAITEVSYYKEVEKTLWLYNPVSGLYYSLRHKKDIFSTLNQSTGAYCFDLYLDEIIKMRPQVNGQFHDECILEVKVGHRDKAEAMLKRAIDNVNNRLKLNTELGISFKFGNNYAEIH